MPFFIMFFVLYAKGIYFGSSKTILASDGFHQYVIFAQNLRNILHGSDSLFYTFTSGLGLNFYALISYYLGSFFSPLFYFFTLENMPDAIYLFTLIKFGLIGLSTYFSFHKIYPKIKKVYILSLSLSFSLMSFLTSQLEINTWLDVFILIPLIILGLHLLLKSKLIFPYYLSLSILFIQNYYFGYMISIFLFLYILVLLTEIESWKAKIYYFSRFTVVSILSALTSAIMLLPTYLDLSTHGEEFTRLSKLFTDNTWYLDLLTKNILGTYDTTQFNSIPMLYGGLFPVFLAFIYFTLQSIKWQTKLAYGALILFIFISYYLQPLDLFWQGMHAPNMFLHRYFWTVPLLFIILSCEVLHRLEEIKIKDIVLAFISISLLLAIPYLFLEKYSFLTPALFFLSISFLTAYAIIFLSIKEKNVPLLIIFIFTVIFTALESSLNTYYVISGLEKEWGFPSKEDYERHSKDITKLIARTKKENANFYRTERILGQTGNDSMKFNYNGISQFSSIRNRTSSRVLDRLGFKSEGTNLNLRYQNNTIIMDSLLAVTYNLSEDQINKYGFEKIDSSDKTKLYQNTNASSLAILTKQPYINRKFSVNTLDNQTKLLNQLSGKNYTYFQEQNNKLLGKNNYINNRLTSKAAKDSKDTIIHYQVSLPKDSQLYISIPNITFSDGHDKRVLIRIDGKTSEYSTDNAFTFFNLGYYQETRTIDVDLIFPQNPTISFDKPHFYSLDTRKYQEAISAVNKNKVKVKTVKNNLIASYQAKRDSSLFLTIPYDKGWSAKINQQEVAIKKAQDGFMSIDVKKGKGKLLMTFVPNGLKEGIFISIFAFFLASIYQFLTIYKSKKRL
nr:YfhO family protein [Streptococcus catagoni]